MAGFQTPDHAKLGARFVLAFVGVSLGGACAVSPEQPPPVAAVDPEPAFEQQAPDDERAPDDESAPDCLLNADTLTCKDSGVADPSLRKKLGTMEISEGIASIRDGAKACGSEHGATPGTAVAIVFSIRGSTGTVASATATGEHAASALGECVEAEAAKGIFAKFQDPQQGFQFTFRM